MKEKLELVQKILHYHTDKYENEDNSLIYAATSILYDLIQKVKKE